ncbi:hypothetical protein L227DRAFT_597408 [Lentinus tigrinus ALCF2SS1-6]|uniref:Uncharacterized protein n=1 Tax=Lentinus tigrinus ALCF2SS1-6 TaxID=1328759 RepID=A0A5C2SQF7_9APHY|nr:hypothetical protein L227DRAFT_597408 [Lentinus tigrinus ALCF2SS1-6]
MATGTSTSSSATSLLLTAATDDSSCAHLLTLRSEYPSVVEDLISIDDVVCSSPTLPIPAEPPINISTPPGSDLRQQRNFVVHLNVSSPTPQSASGRDVETELRDIVDGLLRKKKDAQCTLADENASLRAEVAFFKQALLQASSQPGCETAIVIAALEQERTLRQNAEELHAATGKYLAEQVDYVSRQKLLLETELRDFTREHDTWKAKAIAALERCEALEVENLQVKTQLNALARKQSSTVAQQLQRPGYKGEPLTNPRQLPMRLDVNTCDPLQHRPM